MRVAVMFIFAATSAQLPAADTHRLPTDRVEACTAEQRLPHLGVSEGAYALFAVPNVSVF